MLLDKLIKHSQSGGYPMHMPGHKRAPADEQMHMHLHMPGHKRVPADEQMHKYLPFDLDITELPGFDDLHDMRGVLLETAQIASKLYGSYEAFLLINGSTAGNLAAIGAHTRRGDKVLIESNCHQSVSNAVSLFGLEPVFITPDIDSASGVACSVSPELINGVFRREPDIRLVVITSPTYEGVVSDIAAIAGIVHSNNALLHVDCAHGAHFGISRAAAGYIPDSPVTLGADTAVTSLHKTLPALTQCSLLHICSGRADAAAVKNMLGILQTSSPSYVLLASIDYCLRLLAGDGNLYFTDYIGNLEYFYRQTKLKRLSLLSPRPGFFALDPGRIVIVTGHNYSATGTGSSMSGFDLAGILREKHNIELERAAADYAIAITSIFDTRDGISRLSDALLETDLQI